MAKPNFDQFQPLELWIMVVLLARWLDGWRLPPTRVRLLLLLHLAFGTADTASFWAF
jgi:hypothetical protein